MKLSDPKTKNFLIFSQKMFFLYLGKQNFLKKPIIFQEGTFGVQKIKKVLTLKIFLYFLKKKFFLYFRRWNYLVPRLKTFLHFPKNVFLTFRETEPFKKTYVSGENFTSSKIKKGNSQKVFYTF